MEDYRILAESISDLTQNQRYILGGTIGVIIYFSFRQPIKNAINYMVSQVGKHEEKVRDEEREHDSLDDRIE